MADAMAINRNNASSSLQDIAGIARRTQEQQTYASISTMLIVWGVLVAGGYVHNHFNVSEARWTWLGILLVGMGVTAWSRVRYTRESGTPPDYRVVYSMIALLAFGFLWGGVLGRLEDREAGTFWPTLFMFGYVVAGFWLGKFFTLCGIAVTVLVFIGYFWLGTWFHLWMAVIMAGAFIGSGLWLRRLRTPA